MTEKVEKKPKIVSQKGLDERVADDLVNEEKNMDSKPEETGLLSNQWIAIGAIVVFVAVFLVMSFSQAPTTYDVDGILFKSSIVPEAAFNELIDNTDTVVLTAVQPSGDTVCTYNSLIQLAAGLGAANKTPEIQIRTGESCIGYGDTVPTNCRKSTVTIRQGSCNCVKIGNGEMIVEGSDKFLCNSAVKISDFISFAATGRHLDLSKANELLEKYRQEHVANQTLEETGDVEAGNETVEDNLEIVNGTEDGETGIVGNETIVEATNSS